MKRFMMVAITSILVLSGCAASDTGAQGQGTSTLDREDPPLGSLIKRKQGGTGPQSASQADLQQLDNARMTGNGAIGDGSR
jgi:hypothetical protein